MFVYRFRWRRDNSRNFVLTHWHWHRNLLYSKHLYLYHRYVEQNCFSQNFLVQFEWSVGDLSDEFLTTFTRGPAKFFLHRASIEFFYEAGRP